MSVAWLLSTQPLAQSYSLDLVVSLVPDGSDHDIPFKFEVKMSATTSMLIKEQSNIPISMLTETSAK